MGMTIAEKILAKASGKKEITTGEIVCARVDMAAVTDTTIFTKGVVEALEEVGIKRVWDPDRIAITFDHRVPDHNVTSAEVHKTIRKFVREQNIKFFYDVGRHGISHQIFAERGHARPGMLYVADDTQATTLGAFGAFAVMLGIDMLEVFATGETWFRTPETIKFNITGYFGEGVMSRDLIQWILADIGSDRALYKVMEFDGPTVNGMSIDSRMTICNLVTNAEAETAIINPDQKTVNYIKTRTKEPLRVMNSDADAIYEEVFDYNVAGLEPLITLPNDPLNSKAVVEADGIEIDQAYIGSCASGRIEDLEAAAKVLAGRSVHPRVRLIIIPSSQEIYLNAVRQGLMEVFIQAGASIFAPTCGPCFGAHSGVLAAEETCIATAPLNLAGRMGSDKAKIYLASPFTVAASAVEGKITDPRKFV